MLSLSVDTTSGLSIDATKGLTLDLNNHKDLSNFTKKNADETITGNWTIETILKLKEVGLSVGTDNTLTVETTNGESYFKIKSGTGVGIELSSETKLVFKAKDEIKFEKAPKSIEATDDDQLPIYKQVKDHVKDELAKIKGTVYTGTGAINVSDTNEISLTLKTDGGLKIENNELLIDLANFQGMDNFLKKNEDATIDAVYTFKKSPKCEVEATDDKEFITLGKAKELVKGGGIEYKSTDAITVDSTKHTISLKVKSDSGLKITNEGLQLDLSKEALKLVFEKFLKVDEDATIRAEWTYTTPISGVEAVEPNQLTTLKQVEDKIKTAIDKNNGNQNGGGQGGSVTTPPNNGQQPNNPDADKYTRKDVEETIEKKWNFNEIPTSSKDATDDNQLVRYSQVKNIIQNGGNPGNGGQQPGQGGGQNGQNPGGGVGGNNQQVDLTDYTKRNVAENIDAQWKFKKVPSTEEDPVNDNDFATVKKVRDLIKENGGVANIPGLDTVIDKAKEEVNKVVDKGKADINATAAGHVTMIQTLGNQTEEAIKKLAEGAVKHSNLIYDNTKSRLEQEGQAQQVALAELAEKKMAEFRRISHPMEKETITFSTLDPVASGRGNIVGFQKVIVDMTGKIIKYGDMMVKGGESGTYRCDPNAKKASRLNFPTSEIEFDRWTFNFISFAAIPKRGQRINLHALGYKDNPDEDIDLDYVVFFLGNNDSGQFGTGNKTQALRAIPIKFEDRVKQVFITEWNQGGGSQYVQSFVLLDNGELHGAGRNDTGQFGLGNTTESLTFKKVKDNVDNIVGEMYGSVTFIQDKQGAYWKAGAVNNYDFGNENNAWRQISSNNCSHFHYFSEWNGHNRSYATELWFDKEKGMWMGRGNNDYYQRDVGGKNEKPNEQKNYLTLNRIRDKLLFVYNYAISMYALSATTLYSWGHRVYPFNTSWNGDQANFKEAREAELPLPNVEFIPIQFRNSTTTNSYKTSLCLYYPSVHRLFYAGTIIGSFGLAENKDHYTWTEIDLPPKRNPDSIVEIRYFVWNTYYQLAIIQEGKLYLAGEGTTGNFFEPKSTLFNEQQI